MIAIGQKVKVIYDPRPLFPRKEFDGVVKEITQSGFLKIETGQPHYDIQLFHSPMTSAYRRNARGWNTLWWEPVS